MEKYVEGGQKASEKWWGIEKKNTSIKMEKKTV